MTTEQPIDPQIIDDSPVDLKIKDNQDNTNITKQQSVIQDFEISIGSKIAGQDTIIMPSDFPDATVEILKKMPNINIADNVKTKQWAEVVGEGLELGTFREVLKDTLYQDKEEYRQHNQVNNITLDAQSPKFKVVENQNLTGERAVLRFISHLGLGSLFQVPLWHSGFWITFKPPTESEIIELNRLLTSDKITFGRFAYGLLHSNTTIFTIDRLVDFALSHVYDVTIKSDNFSMENIKEHISSQDIHTLLWGFICTMYPKGFNYKRACITDPEKCNYILEETLNVTKLQWTSISDLTDWQKNHMADRQPKSKDFDSVKRYRAELNKTQDKKITINQGTEKELSIVIKSPSIAEYIESGYRWINDIVNTVDKTLEKDANIKERNALITRYGQAASMRQYIHWVKSLEYSTNISDDKETIEMLMDSLSTDDIIRDGFIKAVVDYINNSSISIIGIPVFNCPSCNKIQESKVELPRFSNIIPLDVISLFFGLLTQRISRMMDR